MIFELSTWKNDNQSIRDWLIEQLYDRFGGNRRFKRYEQWLDGRVLLPLLDGLDELGLVRQRQCTEKLNQFAKHYPRMVVCCRIKEFETINLSLDKLKGLVSLQPLSDAQIQDYLIRIGQPQMWHTLKASPEMHRLLESTEDSDVGLLRVPLFISIAAQTYDFQQPFRDKNELLEAYVDRQLSIDVRRSDRKLKETRQWAYQTLDQEPSWQTTHHYLRWLATKLNQNSQIDLLLEQMQPTWLDTAAQKQLYRLTGLLIGVLTSILFVALLPMRGSILIPVLILASIIVLIFVLVFLSNSIEPVEVFQFSIINFKRQEIVQVLQDIMVYSSIAIILSLIFCLFTGKTFEATFVVTLFFAFAGIVTSLFGSLSTYFDRFKAELKTRSYPNQGIWRSLHSMILATLFAFPLSTLSVVIRQLTTDFPKNISSVEKGVSFIAKNISISIGAGIFVALMLSFSRGGGIAFVKHFCLRFVLAHSSSVPFFYVPFLNYCTERRLLKRIGGRYRFIHRELLDYFAHSRT